jgi:hypothetical protein
MFTNLVPERNNQTNSALSLYQSDFAKELVKLRQKAIKQNLQLWTIEQINQELSLRRGTK